MKARALLLGLALPAAACGEDPAPPPGPEPALELGAVVQERIAQIERELAANRAVPGEPDSELPERIAGLIEILASGDDSLTEIALEEVSLLGAATLPLLQPVLEDATASDERRAAAMQLVGAVPTESAAELLLVRLETDPEAWIRTHAAWRLGSAAQDWTVPRILLRLKYESDYETVTWIADTLAQLGNYSGLGVLFTILVEAREPADTERARQRMASIASEAGIDDPAEVWRVWLRGDPEGRLGAREASARYELEVWRWIGRFEEFQLRGVDDGRYILESLGPPAARLLGRALFDRSVYVRVHSAQSLQRMGPRGALAGPELVRALGDPDLAPNAALALGSVRFPAGESALMDALEADDPELRLAAIRALGYLGETATEASAQRLRSLCAETPPAEFLQAAQESLVLQGRGEDLIESLVQWLTSREVEPATSQRALGSWLAARARDGSSEAEGLLQEWEALRPRPNTILSTEDRERLAQRRSELILRAREVLP